MKSLISAISALLLLLSTASQATILNTQPEKCPSINSIKTAGINHVEKSNGVWLATQKSKYNMKEEWSFIIGPFHANDPKDALIKATTALSTLRFDSGPISYKNGRSGCNYKIDLEHANGFAVSSNIKSNIIQTK